MVSGPAPLESADELVAPGASETTQHEEYFIDLLQPTVEHRRETQAAPVTEGPVDLESAAEGMQAVVGETSKPEEVPAEVAGEKQVEEKQQTRVEPVTEILQVFIFNVRSSDVHRRLEAYLALNCPKGCEQI